MEQGQTAAGLSVGIIMDGNGRWAKKRGLPRTAGHRKGAEVFEDISRHANEQGVKAITYYAFSTENWCRPKEELKVIHDLFGRSLKRLYNYVEENNRVLFLGDRSPLAAAHIEMMDDIESRTKDRTGMTLNIAINYGGRQEIVRAARQLAQDAQENKIHPDDINEDSIAEQLYTHGQPDPDFILRTSGEQRLSNFLLWQSAYSELVFTDLLWPDFTRADFDAAVAQYRGRSRRYGGI